MKMIVNVARWIVGVLFIFSGLVKANDPNGLSYKMQEFFERWAADGFLPGLMNWLHGFSLEFSFLTITLEIIVGVGLLLGIWKRFFIWLTFILIVFFSWLTGYAALSGKIATCGCFGDCLPLTSMQSFIKDIVLLVLVLILILGQKHIKQVFTMSVSFMLLLFSVVIVVGFQWYVMHYMPLVDCLPFKTGNDILELRKMPADAVPDKKDYVFVYEKGGVKEEFSVKDLPDSSWTFVSRRDVIIEKGYNNEPPIKDYNLITPEGNDTTESILMADADYYLFYTTDVVATSGSWASAFKKIFDKAGSEGRKIYVVTADPSDADRFFNVEHAYNIPVLSLDAVAFKTAARTNPELYLMHGPVVKKKWGKASLSAAGK
ncbi:MAG TPA: DoxX family protein [Ginsengibacter sp.]|nr:DoxX family protein [Ginsengibacter sp.]HRP17535.1 DoxX family protein [Ginsengibacter sp.]HRP45022.1 DoxX family protein [Ginsengibacter sp.]